MRSLFALRPFWLAALLFYCVYVSLTSKSISYQVRSVVPQNVQNQARALSHAASVKYSALDRERALRFSKHRGAPKIKKTTNAAKLKVQRMLKQPFPKIIWQTSDLERRRRNVKGMETWHRLNPGYRHMHLNDEDNDEFVRQTFKDRPSIIQAWGMLALPVMQSDFLRYLMILAKGGVYTDIDTECVVPIDEWIPERFQDKPVNVVLGIEYMGPQWFSFKPAGVVQYTFMAKPGHAIMENVVSRVMSNLDLVARRYGKDIPLVEPLFEEVLAITGPGALSDSLEWHFAEIGVNFIWEQVQDLKEEIIVGDVLILPINAFGSGQEHSHSGEAGYGTKLISHKFQGTWFKDDDQRAEEIGIELAKANPKLAERLKKQAEHEKALKIGGERAPTKNDEDESDFDALVSNSDKTKERSKKQSGKGKSKEKADDTDDVDEDADGGYDRPAPKKAAGQKKEHKPSGQDTQKKAGAAKAASDDEQNGAEQGPDGGYDRPAPEKAAGPKKETKQPVKDTQKKAGAAKAVEAAKVAAKHRDGAEDALAAVNAEEEEEEEEEVDDDVDAPARGRGYDGAVEDTTTGPAGPLIRQKPLFEDARKDDENDEGYTRRKLTFNKGAKGGGGVEEDVGKLGPLKDIYAHVEERARGKGKTAARAGPKDRPGSGSKGRLSRDDGGGSGSRADEDEEVMKPREQAAMYD